MAQTRCVSNHAAQQLTAALVGFRDHYFQVPHCPHPMRRSPLATYFAGHGEQLEANLASRLRAPEQFLLVGLADHLEIQAGTAILDNRLRTVRFKPASLGLPGLRRQLARADADGRVAFGCVQSLDLALPPVRQTLLDWLDRRAGSMATLLAAH